MEMTNDNYQNQRTLYQYCRALTKPRIDKMLEFLSERKQPMNYNKKRIIQYSPAVAERMSG